MRSVHGFEKISGGLRTYSAFAWRRKLTAGVFLCVLVVPAGIGLYFLTGRSLHSAQHVSRESSQRIATSDPVHVPNLEVSSVIHHGHILEIKGSTDTGAIVMINGEPAATIFEEHSFRHFLEPVSSGTTIITITIQNEQGGVTTRQLAVTVD